MANEVLGNVSFHHIALKCKDIEKSISMYSALGMKEVVRWGEGEKLIVMMDIGNGEIIEMFANGGDEFSENGKWQHFAIKVDDVDLAFNKALEIGFEPHILPKFAPLDSKPEKMTLNVAFVKGPDGEQLEFFKIV